MSSIFSRVITSSAPLIALLLSACGGGGGSNTSASNTPGAVTPQGCTSSTCGQVMVAVTDADGDFLSYSVDVVSLKLKKANGDVVDTLPSTTRVDFAQLVDLTEFFTAATIPNGTYVEGTLRLDFSSADITVEVNGQPRAAQVVGDNGQPLGAVDVDIMLDNANHVVVGPGRPAFMQLDFDLAATHTVDITTTPVKAVARPFIVATIQPVTEKEMRVRGPLVSVDTAGSSYTIDVRPFLHRTARFGSLKILTTGATAFEIDGVPYSGAAGLTALSQLGAGTATAAFGTLNLDARTFTAERVHAGTSEPGDRFDVVWGNVTARTGNTLTVRGATVIRRSGAVSFVRDDVKLLVGANTGVTRDGQRGTTLNAGAISVGQRISAFGQASADSTGALTLDATAGRVRLQLTHLWGVTRSAMTGLLTLDLDAIDGRRVSAFNFSGTGTAPSTDADPDNYEIATGNLDLNLLATGTPARVFGFVTPFGAAPPDFEGRTAVDFATVRAELRMGWGTGASAPFSAADGAGIVIDNDNTNIGARHHIWIGPRALDIVAMPAGPRIVAAGDRGLYAIAAGLRVEVFADFQRFTTRLNEKFGAGAKALAMTAFGGYEASTNTLNAREVHISMTN